MIVQELIATLGLEVDEEVFEKMHSIFHGLSKGLVGLGAAFGAAVVGVGLMVHHTAEAGDEAGKLGEQLGETAQTVQALQFAATMSNASTEALSTGLRGLARTSYEASKGGQEAKDTFAAIGVSVLGADGKLKGASALLGDIADKFQAMPNGQEKAALAMRVFGRAGRELIPLLNHGAKGIEELKQEAEDLGIVMDQETIEASERYDKSSKRLAASLTGLRNSIAGPLIDAFASVAAGLAKGIGAIGKWIRDTKLIERVTNASTWALRRMVEVLRAIALALPIAALAWVVLTAAQASAGSSLLGLIIGYTALGVEAVAAALSTAASWMLAVLPFVLLAAAIVLVYDELYNFVTGGETMLGRLIKWFETSDPTDGAFFKALKAAGALLFDLTDTAKWKALGKAIVDLFVSIGTTIKSAIGPTIDWISEKVRMLAGVIGRFFGSDKQVASMPARPRTTMGEDFAAFAQPFADMGGASSPAASTKASEGATSNSSKVTDARVFSPQINVSVPPGTDAHGIANATSSAVQSSYETELNASYAAVNQ